MGTHRRRRRGPGLPQPRPASPVVVLLTGQVAAMHVGVSVQPLLLHGQPLQLGRLGVHGLQLVGRRHGRWDGSRQVSGVGGACQTPNSLCYRKAKAVARMRPPRRSDQERASRGEDQEITYWAGTSRAEPPRRQKCSPCTPPPAPLGPRLLSLLPSPHRGLPSALLLPLGSCCAFTAPPPAPRGQGSGSQGTQVSSPHTGEARAEHRVNA